MVIPEISSALEKRKLELVDMLETNKELELEKQHQLFGAINEIDLFLQTLEYYQNNAESENPIRLAKPPEEKKGLFTTLFGKFSRPQ